MTGPIRSLLLLSMGLGLLPACGAETDADEAADGALDGAAAMVSTDGGHAALPICDEATHKVNLGGPFSCSGEPETVTLTHGGKTYEVFKYEASHPLATAKLAYPCAVSDGIGFDAPDVPTPACSLVGVRPWHSVSWEDAQAACEETGEGWRLCTKEELGRACAGPEDTVYTWGDQFDGSKCNLRNVFVDPATMRTSEAPTGHYPDCHSPEGVFDADGNVWEWVSDLDREDPRVRYFQGAGWKIIAQRHQDHEQACRTETRLIGAGALSYSNGFVGFRCCRDK